MGTLTAGFPAIVGSLVILQDRSSMRPWFSVVSNVTTVVVALVVLAPVMAGADVGAAYVAVTSPPASATFGGSAASATPGGTLTV